MLKSLILLATSVVATLPWSALALELSDEASCQQGIERFIGLQQHVSAEGDRGVPAFVVGLTQQQLQQLISEGGYCHAWQALQQTLHRQHSAILDATEKKTGQPSPIR